MSAYSDEQLVLEALDDSHPAFEQLVKQYQYRVLRTIASIISDKQAAQDVAQETFLLAWRDLPKLREKQKFGRWLNQIAISSSKLWLRDQRKYQINTVSLEAGVVPQAQELRNQRERLRQWVWDAIDVLSGEHREVVILHYISGYSYKEIGEMLSVPVSTIQGRLQKARNQLRKEFLDMVKKLQPTCRSTVSLHRLRTATSSTSYSGKHNISPTCRGTTVSLHGLRTAAPSTSYPGQPISRISGSSPWTRKQGSRKVNPSK